MKQRPRRVRGMGAGRRTRRSLGQGGTGTAGELNEMLARWPRVKITPMFGRWGYFVGPQLFACFPLRAKDTDLWIRLAPDDQARALREEGVRPHRRFAGRGWIELDVRTDTDVLRALRWLRRAGAVSDAEPDADEAAGADGG